ncbi:GspH/FimT family pseudopilin [Zooshikella ganghwensis]|uniref:GspH/FimT family pseudopilin n=1 Tax=Zooshikella ganghwensis TaxID=202772 RepID=UPI0013FD1F86|nr:GspH/FimT family pseudopilin [Zooshikella ganghwensis]
MNNKVSGVRDTLARQLSSLRGDSINNKKNKVLCLLNNNKNNCANESISNTGWLIFEDENNDGLLNNGEIREKIFDFTEENLKISITNNKTKIRYNKMGIIDRSDGVNNFSIVICSNVNNTKKYALTVGATGSIQLENGGVLSCD